MASLGYRLLGPGHVGAPDVRRPSIAVHWPLRALGICATWCDLRIRRRLSRRRHGSSYDAFCGLCCRPAVLALHDPVQSDFWYRPRRERHLAHAGGDDYFALAGSGALSARTNFTDS